MHPFLSSPPLPLTTSLSSRLFSLHCSASGFCLPFTGLSCQHGPGLKELPVFSNSWKVSFKPTRRKTYNCFSLKQNIHQPRRDLFISGLEYHTNFLIAKVSYGFTPWISLKWRSLGKTPFGQMAVTPQLAGVWESKLLAVLLFLSRIFPSAPLPLHRWRCHPPQSPKPGYCPHLQSPHPLLVIPERWACVSLSVLHPPLYQGRKLGKDK